MRALNEHTDKELENLVSNYKSKGATDQPRYAEILLEIHRRNGDRLDLKRSLAYLKKHAALRRFVTYGELAEANGCSWNEVRYPMNTHLWVVVEYANHRKWPMLSAMIVNKSKKDSGKMEDTTLKGFITAARALGYLITDEQKFLEEQQNECFKWGADETIHIS